MIDIHSHFIPHVDDGAENVEETFNMIKEASKVGFTDMIATPHYILNYYEKDASDIKFWVKKIQEVVNQGKENIKIHSGMEIYISDQIEDLLTSNSLLKLANSKYILIELPISSKIKYLENKIFLLKAMGLYPIIAHPERYKYVQENPKIVEEYIKSGCLIQCNYGSIVGFYGKEAEDTIKTLLKMNLVHFLGSDCHKKNSIYTIIPEAIRRIKKIIGKNLLNELTTQNPKKIINNLEWKDIDIN